MLHKLLIIQEMQGARFAMGVANVFHSCIEQFSTDMRINDNIANMLLPQIEQTTI